MSRRVPLNNADHLTIRVKTERSARFGDDVMAMPVFPHEFRRAQAHYPIVFARDGRTASFRPFALFGLEEGENLFLTEAGWDAHFVPAALRMRPFLIGRGGKGGQEVHIDLDSPRIEEGGGEGERVFDEAGEQTDFLRDTIRTLAEVGQGDEASTAFCALVAEMDLFEPFTLDATMKDGSEGRLVGYYVIDERRLRGLDDETLVRLQHADALMPVYMAVASIGRFEALLERRNARLTG